MPSGARGVYLLPKNGSTWHRGDRRKVGRVFEFLRFRFLEGVVLIGHGLYGYISLVEGEYALFVYLALQWNWVSKPV